MEVEIDVEQTDEPQPKRATFDGASWLVAAAAGAFILGIMLRTGSVLCPNDQSRWDTVWSLVERGTYVIDEAPWAGTIDKVHRDGHDYSSKPALFPTILAGEYWLIKKLTKWTLHEHTDRVCRIIMFTWNVVPLVIYIGLLGQLIAHYAESAWWRMYWLIAAAFGTYVTGYSVTLNDHTIGALSACFALYCALRILHQGDGRWWLFALGGLFAVFTVCNQLPSAFFAVALFAWLLIREPKRTLLFGLPAALMVVGAFMLTTYISTGGFVPYYLYKHTALYQYEGSYWSNPVGIDALNEPKHIYLFNLLIGHHGFFSLSPVFILMAVGMVFALRDGRSEIRQLAGFVLAVGLVTIALNTWKTNNYGGVCQGFRYLIWPVPLFIIVGSLKADAYGKAKWVRVLAVLFLFASIVSVGCCTDNPWSPSWLEDLCKKHDWLWATY